MDREERLEKNQELFQRANDRLAELVADSVSRNAPVPFLCECSDDECLESVSLPLARYEELHRGTDRYVTLPGHLMAENERVVEDLDGLWVTEKG